MGSVWDFQYTAVYKSPIAAAADGSFDRPIAYIAYNALWMTYPVEPLAQHEASGEEYTSSVAGLAVVDLPAFALAVIAVVLAIGLVLRLELAAMPEVVLGVGLGVGPAVLLVIHVVVVGVLVTVFVAAVAVARAKAGADAVRLVLEVAVAVAEPVAVFVVVAVTVQVGIVEAVAFHDAVYSKVHVVLLLEAVAPVLVLGVALPVVASPVECVIVDAGFVADCIMAILVS